MRLNRRLYKLKKKDSTRGSIDFIEDLIRGLMDSTKGAWKESSSRCENNYSIILSNPSIFEYAYLNVWSNMIGVICWSLGLKLTGDVLVLFFPGCFSFSK